MQNYNSNTTAIMHTNVNKYKKRGVSFTPLYQKHLHTLLPGTYFINKQKTETTGQRMPLREHPLGPDDNTEL